MKNVFLLFCVAVLLMMSCKKAGASFDDDTYEKNISLNGDWQFLASNTVAENEVLIQDYKQWDTLKVPGNWDTRKRYSEYVGKGYYQKNISLPVDWDGKQIRLKFGAVYQTAKVWLNGKLLGEHIGGYLPFEYNITDFVKKGETNSILVMADNSYKRGAWWAWGGISRDVIIKANDDVRFIYQHITSEPDFKNGEVNFTIKYKIQNNGKSTSEVNIRPSIKGIKSIKSLATTLKGEETKTAVLKFKKQLSDVKLWHFNTPNLYELKSKLWIANQQKDQIADNFGIRKFEVRGEQFYLNNEAVRMNGINRVHDHPDYGNTEPLHLVEKDMQDIKSLGCNFARLMHAPLSKNILDFCDKNGFLLVEEIPVWGDDDPQSFPNNPLTKQWLKDMIERDFNHPSVVAWSVGNELRKADTKWSDIVLTPDQYGYVDTMLDYVDEVDPTRLKTYVTITSYKKGEIGTEPYEKVDFISMNSYGNAPLLAQKTHEKFPGKPIFISEIGIGQIGPAPKGKLTDKLVGHLNELKEFPWVTGVSLWSYNDYRSNYKGTPESGFREWGIVDEKRNKKEAYYQIKKIYGNWHTKPLPRWKQ